MGPDSSKVPCKADTDPAATPDPAFHRQFACRASLGAVR
jgi:hypothetical protein